MPLKKEDKIKRLYLYKARIIKNKACLTIDAVKDGVSMTLVLGTGVYIEDLNYKDPVKKLIPLSLIEEMEFEHESHS